MKKLSFTLGSESSTVVFCSPQDGLARDRREAVYVTDTSIYNLHSRHFPGSAAGAPQHAVEVLSPGEKSKDWPNVERILNAAFALGMARDGQFIGVGGGVITDLTGFAASIFMRGCDLVLVPTTLLAMVDAAFGGKTGINFAGLKNMVGSFLPAREVRISTEFVRTLSEREYYSGLAEVIKSAALDDSNLLDILEGHVADIRNRKDSVLQELVFRSIGVKGRIVEADLREQGIRAHLNLGHTFAHALESVAGFGAWSHGEAVAWGILRALDLGVRLGITPEAYATRIAKLISTYGFRTLAEADTDALLNAMRQDKKKKDGKLRFIVQAGLCDTRIVEAEDAIVREVLDSPRLV